MSNIDFEQYTIPELDSIIKEATAARERRKRKDIEVARIAAQQAAAQLGFSISEIFPGVSDAAPKVDGRKGIIVKPKYQNPNNPAETWTGRGRTPKWVEAQLANGASLENLLINKAA